MDVGQNSTDPPVRRRDWGGVLLGIVLLGIGAWVLLRDTMKVDLPDIAWDELWPVLLMLAGLVILLRASLGTRGRRRDR